MKVFRCRIIKFSVFLTLILLFGQTVSSQENKCEQASLDSILTKLRFNPLKPKSVEQINRELINEIREKKVSFNLDAKNEKALRESGANDLLIETIRQNPPPKASKDAILIFQKYVDNYDSNNIEKVKIAIEAAKEFVAKFENDGCYIEQVKYFKETIPLLERYVESYGKIQPFPKDPINDLKWKLLGKIEKAYKIKNWNEVFALGEKVLEIDPEYAPLIIVLAGVGFDQAKLNGDKSEFNDETVRYAKLAVKLIEADKNSNNYGALDYIYKTYKFPDGRENALGWMNYIVGFMKYYRFNQQNEALLYLYKATQHNSETRNFADIYKIFGLYYYDKLVELDKEKTTLLEKNSEADTSEITERINNLLERTIDATARCYDAAKKDPKIEKTEVKRIYDELQNLIKLRYKNELPYDFEKLISTILEKPMPDPANQ